MRYAAIFIGLTHGARRATTKDENGPRHLCFVFNAIGSYFHRSERGKMIETTPLTSRVKGIQVSLRRRGLPGESAACFLRSEEHTSELQSPMYLVCRLLLEKKNTHIGQ